MTTKNLYFKITEPLKADDRVGKARGRAAGNASMMDKEDFFAIFQGPVFQ